MEASSNIGVTGVGPFALSSNRHSLMFVRQGWTVDRFLLAFAFDVVAGYPYVDAQVGRGNLNSDAM